MNNTVLISEVVHNGEVHLQVNSCFVQMISSLYPSHTIVFRAEKSHVLALEENLKNKYDNIEFLSFERYYDEKKYNWLRRIFGEIVQIIKTVRLGKSIGNNLYIWTCLFPTGHFFLNLLTIFQWEKKHLIILHGELEYLKNKNRRKSEVLFGIILKTAIFLSNQKIKYVVLGDIIKNNLSEILSKRVLKRTYSVLHPYDYFVENNSDNSGNSNSSKNSRGLIIGAIGTQMLSKKSHYIYRLAEFFNEDVVQKKLVLRTIGKVLPEIYQYDNGLVEKLFSDSFISQKKFEIEISKLDFIVFFYDNTAYQLCASGAVFEAIRMGVPIISIRNDYFQWLFDTYGEMGFLCENEKDMVNFIIGIKDGKFEDKLERFKKNMLLFKNKNNLKNLALNFKEIL